MRLMRISELDRPNPLCKRCDGTGWVCENHPDVPWADMTGEAMCRSGVEGCNGAGMPCPDCNTLIEEFGKAVVDAAKAEEAKERANDRT